LVKLHAFGPKAPIMNEYAFLSATELAKLIRDGAVGSLELLERFVARIERYNPQVNAIVVMDLHRAREQAQAADRAVKAGLALGPLHGVPMTVKESFGVIGLPTTFGLPGFRNNIATENALAVDRLSAAGAIIFGKTNVPPWLADSQSANKIHGATGNPWNLERSPGGSSGGAAAALAAGLTGLELGSDIAGSIRNPAHYCGVFGHKPTYGICPATGHGLTPHIADADISVIGPLARSAADLEIALRAIAGPDEIAARAFSFSLPPARKNSLRDFRVAIVADDPRAEVDNEVQRELEKLGEFLGREKAQVSFAARPDFDARDLDAIYMTMVRAATATRLSDAEFAEASARARATDLRATDIATKTLRGNTLSHRDWIVLNETRHEFRLAWHRFFAEFDLLLCPIAVTAAFPRTAIDVSIRSFTVNGKQVPYTDQLFWAGYGGLTYLPATVAPIGTTAEGLPVGVQIIGPQYEYLTCIEFARLLERHYRPFIAPPGYA
jgi:amidase